MSEHAPGPWECRDIAGAGLGVFANISSVMGEEFAELAMIYDVGVCRAPTFQIACERWVQFAQPHWTIMQKANARLMAAAPELLEAAQHALGLVEELTERGELVQWSREKQLREAIAKATRSS